MIVIIHYSYNNTDNDSDHDSKCFNFHHHSSLSCFPVPTPRAYPNPWPSLADLHAQVCDADAQSGGAPQRGEAAPVPAVPQVLLLQPSAGAAHPGPHRGETLQVLLLRPPLQAVVPRSAAHPTTHWWVPRGASVLDSCSRRVLFGARLPLLGAGRFSRTFGCRTWWSFG